MSEENTGAVEVAEQAPAADTQAPEVQAQPELQPGAETEPQENKGKERLTMRFSELTAQKREAMETAERARQEADYWRNLATSHPRQPEPEPQYGYDDQPDITAEVERVVTQREQRAAQDQAQKARAEKATNLQAKLIESGLEGAILLATDARAPVTMEMVEALAVSEQAALIADHLGRNPSESARIASLPPHLQGYELAKLESRLASLPKTTSALPPPSTVGARAVAGSDPSGMSMEQYIAARSAGQI